MSHLVYCIMREDGNLPGVCLPLDADGHAVRVVTEQGLAAAISEVPDPVPSASLGQLQAFVAVVENLHAMRTVLPMRYGCVLPTEGRVAALLRERGPEFADALDAVEGCAEMSVRAILDEDSAGHANREIGVPGIQPPWKAYLASRQACYASQTLSVKTAAALGERAAAVFRGLFVRYVSQYSLPSACQSGDWRSRNPQTAVLCLHFLVRRSRIESFRSVFQALDRGESAKMLLSGPWPPYNFVQPPEPGGVPAYNLTTSQPHSLTASPLGAFS